jgi:hypothetical protein
MTTEQREQALQLIEEALLNVPHGLSCATRTIGAALARLDGAAPVTCNCWRAAVRAALATLRQGEDQR